MANETTIGKETTIGNETTGTIGNETTTANETTIAYETRIANETWIWTTGAFYLFQPLQVFQFTSLLFGNPDFRSGTITLTLPADCADAQVAIMETLTQRVRDISTLDIVS